MTRGSVWPAETQSDRAFSYYLQQLYEAQRGYLIAYVVESGADAVAIANLPDWHDLTEVEGNAFLDQAEHAIWPLIQAIRKVAALHAKGETS